MWTDPLFLRDPSGMMYRCKHFETRLFEFLPWLPCLLEGTNRLFTPIPPGTSVDFTQEHLKEEFEVLTELDPPAAATAQFWKATSQSTGVLFLYIKDDFLARTGETPARKASGPCKSRDLPTERFCMLLDTEFSRPGTRCECCVEAEVKPDTSPSCSWCLNTKGWHRCPKTCPAPSSFGDLALFRWKPGTLYKAGNQDVHSSILEMLNQAVSRKKIMALLKNLHDNEQIDDAALEELQRLVVTRTGAVPDTDPLYPVPNQQLVLSHNAQRETVKDKGKLRAKIVELQHRMRSLWDSTTASYVHWGDLAAQDRTVPTQALAFAQLKFRFEHGEPILVSVPSPAGYGKSELVAAWLTFMTLHDVHWETLAATGVAATQVAGSTLHSFILMNGEGISSLPKYPERIDYLRRVQGLIIDEAMMADANSFQHLIDILQEYPLLEPLRRVRPEKAIRLLGYRDAILSGDIRQLPPASGLAPFWSTRQFSDFFEIFMLREDRRHERDKSMQSLKEDLAWGGAVPPTTATPDTPWSVSTEVEDFVLDSYLRGWGLSGVNVDLDRGTALFPTRKDVHRWNEDCVSQIMARYAASTSLQGVDVQGFDPQVPTGAVSKAAPPSTIPGVQTPPILKLRTCAEHRMRCLLLSNDDVGGGWANGTRVRLLARNSWPHARSVTLTDVDVARGLPVGTTRRPSTVVHNVQKVSLRDAMAVSYTHLTLPTKRIV